MLIGSLKWSYNQPRTILEPTVD